MLVGGKTVTQRKRDISACWKGKAKVWTGFWAQTVVGWRRRRECVKIWTTNWEVKADRKDLGERGRWRRRREKEVSGGAEPGVRGFEEDSREMDGLEERGGPLFLWEEKQKSVRSSAFSCSLQGRDRLSICQYALINMTKGSNLTTFSVCAGMFPLCVCWVGVRAKEVAS